MNQLYEYIRQKNPAGLQHDVGVQLFLWLYCSSDFLPSSLKLVPLSREVLIETFQRLSDEGLIAEASDLDSPRVRDPATWAGLVDSLLSNRIALDPEFLKGANRYL